jgi:hypothetical protein
MTKAKQWCDEARKILGEKTKAAKQLDERVTTIIKEISKLRKAVTGGKTAMTDETLKEYESRFTQLVTAVRDAGEDTAEIERQSLLLSELKKELAVHLTNYKFTKEKAEKKLEKRQTSNEDLKAYVTERDEAQRKRDLVDTLIKVGADLRNLVDDIDNDLAEAKTAADKNDYGEAMRLVQKADAACDPATTTYNHAKLTFESKRNPIRQKADEGKNHVRKDHVTLETQKAEQELLAAQSLADEGKFIAAGLSLAKAKTPADDAVRYADEYDSVCKQRETEQAFRDGFVNLVKDGEWKPKVTLYDQALAAAEQQAVAHDYVKAKEKLTEATQIRTTTETEVAEAKLDYEQQRDEVDKLLTALKSHSRSAHVSDKTTLATNKLATAKTAADEVKYKAACLSISQAKTACEEGKSFAEKYNAYCIARAPIAGLVNATKGKIDKTIWEQGRDDLKAADLLAEPPTRSYFQATTDAAKVKPILKARLKAYAEDGIESYITKLNNHAESVFAADDVQLLTNWKNEIANQLAAEAWISAIAQRVQARESGQLALDCADRRVTFKAARKKAEDAINLLKVHTNMAPQVEGMKNILDKKAEPLASRKALRFEEAIDICKEMEANCALLTKQAEASKKYKDDKAALDKRFEDLQALPAAPHMGDALQAIAALLTAAEKQADDDDFIAALEWTARVAADLKTAETFAVALAGSAEAREAAGAATDENSVKAAVEKIRVQAVEAAKPPHADLVDHELKQIEPSCKDALEKAAQGQMVIALAAVNGAADMLVLAETVKAQQTHFLKIWGAADTRRDLLTKRTSYPKNQPKVDPIATLLEEAKKQAGKREYVAATETIGKANAAAGEAEMWATERETYANRKTNLASKQSGLTAGTEKTAIGELLTKADEQADNFRFDNARKLLDEAESRMEVVAMQDRMSTLTDDDEDKIIEAAKKIMKLEGGTAILDKFVKGITGGDANILIKKLAKERFGVDFSSDSGNQMVSYRSMYEFMALVPEKHATKSPSLKTAERKKPDDDGGSFSQFSKRMEMNGRPNDGKTEKFTTAQRLKAFGLPVDHDVANDPYAPVDLTGINLFNFTVLHEVGHAVDDRLGFMAARLGKPEFGNWQIYRDLTPIAEAVAADKKYDVNYVKQLLNGNDKPEKPAMPDKYAGGETKWEEARLEVHKWHALATAQNIWYQHTKCVDAAIGPEKIVYQEAYSNNWTSYPLSERAKGLTAYQFRSPNEWFAELYAGYYSKKLKNNHPAAKWLAKV